MFNLKNLTESQEYALYGLRRSGKSRFLVTYSGYRYNKYEELVTTDDFDEIVDVIRKHYHTLLKEHPSAITDINIDDGIDKYDIIDLTESDRSKDTISISLQEIIRIDLILKILEKKKRVNKKNEQN